MDFTIKDLRAAADLVHRHVPPTPQYGWPLLSAEVGAEVWVKHENHTPTGAFKVRGGVMYVNRVMRDRPHVAGLISATRGNHGQSIALAGRTAGLPVTIVVPHGNSADKNAAMRAFGAELIEYGRDFQAAREHAGVLASERGLEMVPSFHDDLVAGGRDLRARNVRIRARSRHCLCPRRHGVGYLRSDRGSRPARAAHRDRRGCRRGSPLGCAIVCGRTSREYRHRRYLRRRGGVPGARSDRHRPHPCRCGTDHRGERRSHRDGDAAVAAHHPQPRRAGRGQSPRPA